MNSAINLMIALGGTARQAAIGAQIGAYERRKTAKTRIERARKKIADKSRQRNRAK